MKTQHTPGTWNVTYTDDGKAALINHGFVAEVNIDTNEHGEANARLIAAAPELLEALEMAYEAMSNSEDADGFDPKVFSKIESAIKKSKGE